MTKSSNKPMDCITLLQKLINAPTITPQECGIYSFLKELLNPYFSFIEQDTNGVKNLFAYSKNFKKDKLPHICFAGHIDVVPAGDGWESDPFCAKYQDGYIYGRGSQDMKSGISAFVCAVLAFLYRYENALDFLRISLLLTSDEEGDGTYGTQHMLGLLEQKGFLPDMVIVAEPTASKTCGDVIKIGRRGSINGVIKIFGKQGHVAYPKQCINPIELLGSRLGKLAGVNLDDGDEDFAPSKLVITDIRAGMEVVNVTPSELKILFNVRNAPQSNVDSVEKYIKEVLEGLEFDLELKQSSVGFITHKHTKLLAYLQESISSVCGKEACLSTSGGTSDARFFGLRGIDVVEIGVPNDRIHAINEHVKVSDVQSLERIFIRFLEVLLANSIG